MILFMVIASIGGSIGVLVVPTTYVDPSIVLLSMFIGGILTTVVAGAVSLKLTLPIGQRIGVLFLIFYMFAYLIHAPETALFTTMSLSFQVFILFQQLIVFLVLAFLISFLFKPTRIAVGLTAELKSYFAQRNGKNWFWRFALAAVLFFPIYFFFGWVFSPITGPYYNSPELGLNLVIPSFEVWLPIEIIRGLIYALTMVPLLAVLRMSRWKLGLWMGLILAIVGAVVPQLVNASWPLPLRTGHGIEMVLDSFAQGLMMACILWVKK
jgi:hypothetical protein